MSCIEPVCFKTKSGKTGVVRSARTEDASVILALGKEVMAEQIYTLTLPEELPLTIEEEEKWIEDMSSHSSKLVLVAVVDSELVGILDFSVGHRQRIAHTGDFGVSIAKPFREDGVGSHLLKSLLEWAKLHPKIEKVNLKVHATNERAMGLYRKLGFVEEGRLRKDLKYSPTHYLDTIVMGKFVMDNDALPAT